MNRTLELLLWAMTPWILDGLTGFRIFTTLYGSFVWGLLFALALLRVQFKNIEFRRNVLIPLVFFAGLWFSYWALNLGSTEQGPDKPQLIQTLLIWTHAGLLSASVGICIVSLVVGLMALARNGSLRKSSWDRRVLTPLLKNSVFRIPSYESLLDLSKSLSLVAFGTWSLGTGIALYKVVQVENTNGIFASLISFSHPLSVSLTLTLVLGLSACIWKLEKHFELHSKSLFSFLLTLAFMIVVSAYFFAGIGFKNHNSFEMFLR